MKKILLAAFAVTTLVACGKTEKIYVVDSLPKDLQTTEVGTTEAPQTTVPRTTQPSYVPPSNYFSATEQRYLDGVYSLYDNIIYIDDTDLLDMAYVICNTLDSGVSIEAVIAVITESMASYANADSYNFISAIMASAIINICPQHTWQINSN